MASWRLARLARLARRQRRRALAGARTPRQFRYSGAATWPGSLVPVAGAQVKLSALFGSPVPEYFATFGYTQIGRVICTPCCGTSFTYFVATML